MKLNILVLNNPLANTTGHQGYIQPEQAVMQQVKDRLEQAVKGCDIRLTDEPVLFKTGLSASTLPHMEHDVAATPVQRKVWQEKMQEREADLTARRQLITSDPVLGFQLPVATIAFPWRCAADIIVSGAHCPGTQADRRIETERPAATDLLMQTAEIEALLILLWGQWGYQRLKSKASGAIRRRSYVLVKKAVWQPMPPVFRWCRLQTG